MLHRILRSFLTALFVCALAGPALADDARPEAADFSLRSLSGERISLAEQRGKVVILSFWATWCAPCKQELPVLQKFLDKYGDDGLTVLAINIDDPKTVAEARRFVKNRKLTMPVLLDADSKVLAKFNPRVALPFVQLIDREGRRVTNHTGFTSGAEKKLEKEILDLLAEKPTKLASP